ncbi:MAG TPA: hypothetical protein PKI46_02985 [Bacteroidales bacterium]|nr:hypothetical protein [Bacteroidales bacterium]
MEKSKYCTCVNTKKRDCEYHKLAHNLDNFYSGIKQGFILTFNAKCKALERENRFKQITGKYHKEDLYLKLLEEVTNSYTIGNDITVTDTTKSVNNQKQADTFEVKDNKIYIKDSRDIKCVVIDLVNKDITFLNNNTNYGKDNRLLADRIKELHDFEIKLNKIKDIIK